MYPFYDQQSVDIIYKEKLEQLQQFRQRNQKSILKTVFTVVAKLISPQRFKASPVN